MMESANILVVEDDPDILELMTFTLESEGYKIWACKDGGEALSILSDESIDLAVLDVMLPGMSGTELCRRIRKDERLESMPVLFVTARNEVTDKLIGFQAGGDDYLGKPFSPKELAARVRSLLKRAKGGKEIYRFRELEIWFERHIVNAHGQRANLTPREFSVLRLLIEGQGKTISRATLLERAWGMEARAGLRSVDIIITRIRDKIRPYGSCIRTVTGFGYQWDPENFREETRNEVSPPESVEAPL